ncbi:MAG: M20/M25/M40 family metallo-hydrolase [Anaerolineales bacterium]|nr:M20/M25/M40 family metallo-hydrolase [Anaerolineales bacterium]
MAKHLRVTLCTGLLFLAAVMAAVAGSVVTAGAQAPAAPDPEIAALIDQVDTDTILDYADQLSGVTPAIIGGSPYTFTTRKTTSGEPIAMATQFAYEFLQAQGLMAQFAPWSACGLQNRNVVGERRGETRPQEIVLVAAHIDSYAEAGGTVAPGADDNGSGSAGVMATAEILAAHTFARTVRFVFFTGEEQGVCGSGAYAAAAAARNDDIVAVINLDMIGYDAAGEPTLRLHTRWWNNPASAGDKAIADAFVGVVDDYELDLVPIVTRDGETASDHSSFWDRGYPAILAIEDDYDDFNPYYHSADDITTHFNAAYFTEFTKAVVGVAATLAVPAQAVKDHIYLPALSFDR